MQTDVLLFFPKIRKLSTSYRSEGPPPIGLGYLAAVCEASGYSTKIIDLNHAKSSPKQIKRIIEIFKPTFLGVSFVTEARFEAFKIFQIAKEVDPRIITVAGGPHPSLTPEDTLSHVTCIDYIVRGEGERSFIPLLDALRNGLKVDDIQGLSYRYRQEIRNNQMVDFIKDLDSLPFPDFRNLTNENFDSFSGYYRPGALKTVPVLSSRGCPFQCNFCATTRIWGAKWRYRSPENVLKEIGKYVLEYGIEAVWFIDDNFNSSPKRMLNICRQIREIHPGLKWICNVRVDNLEEDHVKAMAESGCISVEFGAESGSQRILDEVIHKKIRLEKILKVDEWCHKYGIISDAQFIISHPTETYNEANQTIELIRKLKGRSTLGILKIYPGTEVERIAREKNIIKKDFSWALSEHQISPMSSIMGDAPLYLENMALSQVMGLMSYAWTDIRGLTTVEIIKKALRKVASPKELWTYFKVGMPIVIKKMRRK
jgi:radical SAM superfamily enzyme YgiQ (UPF0313 family)